ncbi:MAG: LysR family transcriptional regulator [Alphaproteobacteria bacterium]|nr:LysR family transcriptional regulator [Alphaproteobacteria bacterium]
MNLTQLRSFHLVALDGSFTKAARSAGISQPTLSGQVKALEDAYRVRLFERRGRGAQMTDIGQSLFAVTARLFAAADEAQALLAGTVALTRGHLRVSADSAYHVVPILAEMRRRHAGLTYAVSIGNAAEVVQQLLSYAADVGVTAKQTSDPRLHALQFRQDHLVLFVPQGHAWARRRAIRLADLAGQEIVLRERGSTTREVFESTLAEAGVRPGSLIEIQTREGVREAVAAGFGIGVVFESEFGTDERFQRVRVADAPMAVGEYVACLQEKRRLTLVRAFLDVAAEIATAGRSAAM